MRHKCGFFKYFVGILCFYSVNDFILKTKYKSKNKKALTNKVTQSGLRVF
jgi:hypothetical protein